MIASVIVPVFNAEEFLDDTLSSIVAQSYRDIEIICVDDGSTDNSLRILEAYRNRDPRITVIPQNNMGPSAARNAGLRQAVGEYVFFLDADDVFHEDLVKTVMQRVEQENIEIVIYNYCSYDMRTKHTSDAVLSCDYASDDRTMTAYDIPDRIFSSFGNNAWTKAFRREFLVQNNLEFDADLRWAEDALFTNKALVLAKTICFIDKVLVTYRMHENNSNQSLNKLPTNGLDFVGRLHGFLQATEKYETFKYSFNKLFISEVKYSLRMLMMHKDFFSVYLKAQELARDFNIVIEDESDAVASCIIHDEANTYLQLQIRELLDEEQRLQKSYWHYRSLYEDTQDREQRILESSQHYRTMYEDIRKTKLFRLASFFGLYKYYT
jgi:glycosyltransferase involved in cell wall biosynthesis